MSRRFALNIFARTDLRATSSGAERRVLDRTANLRPSPSNTRQTQPYAQIAGALRDAAPRFLTLVRQASSSLTRRIVLLNFAVWSRSSSAFFIFRNIARA